MAQRYWLIKSEPAAYSFDQLVEDGTTCWDGVRNYRARNFMREMKVGDGLLYYHSNAKPPHVAGIAEVAREAYPDHTAWDPSDKHYDPKSTPDAPRWEMIDVRAVRRLEVPVSLAELQDNPKLVDMLVVQRGQRLSVMPVTRAEFEEVQRMARKSSG